MGKRKVSSFARKVLEEKFAEKESNLGNSYKWCYTNNPHLLKLAKQWEKVEIWKFIKLRENGDNFKKELENNIHRGEVYWVKLPLPDSERKKNLLKVHQ